MSTASQLMTAEEFFHLPDPVEGGKMELVEGRVITMSPVGLRHGQVAGEIYVLLRAFIRPRRLGLVSVETGFRLYETGVRAPDVSFLRAERVPAGRARRGFVDGPPDLAVEVLSPEDRASEVAEKVLEYVAAGTPRIWVVDPDTESVTVYKPGRTHTLGIEELLTADDAGFEGDEFQLPLREIFGD